MMKAADDLMYNVKAGGKDGVQVQSAIAGLSGAMADAEYPLTTISVPMIRRKESWCSDTIGNGTTASV
jgi:hypothetical protein